MKIDNKLSVDLLLVVILILFVLGASMSTSAQAFEAKNSYPDAPVPKVPDVHSITKAAVVESPRASTHRWLYLSRASIATLVVGEAIDSWGTYKNMTHPKWICGNSPAFIGGYDTNVPGEISNLGDVQMVCGAGPTGQSANWAFDATRAGYFSEGGWVTQLHLADNRNYAGVEGWNIANDIGWYLFARHLERRTDWISKCGAALNLGRGIVHLDLGVGNFLAVSHHQNPNTLDLHVPKDSNYGAPRWWGKS